MVLFCMFLSLHKCATLHRSFRNLLLCYCFFNSILHFNCYVMFHCRNILNVFVHFPLYNHLYFCFFLLLHTVLLVSPREISSVPFSSLSHVQLFVTPWTRADTRVILLDYKVWRTSTLLIIAKMLSKMVVYFILLLANMRVPLVSGFCQFLGMISANLIGLTQVV